MSKKKRLNVQPVQREEVSKEETFQAVLHSDRLLRNFDAGEIAAAFTFSKTEGELVDIDRQIDQRVEEVRKEQGRELTYQEVNAIEDGMRAQFTCEECSAVFDNQRGLNGHMGSHQTRRCQFCAKELGANGIGSHERTCSFNPDRNPVNHVRCPDCEKRMLSTSLRNHQLKTCPVARFKRQQEAIKEARKVVPIREGVEVEPDEPVVHESISETAQHTPVHEEVRVLSEETADMEALALLEIAFPDKIPASAVVEVALWLQTTADLIRKVRG